LAGDGAAGAYRAGAAREKTLVRAVQVSALLLVFLAFAALSVAFPYFPPPHRVLAAAGQLFAGGEIYSHLLVTLYETAGGFAFAVVLGVWLGLLLGISRYLTEVFEPVVLSFYAVPKIIFLPLLLMIFGIGTGSKIANTALHAVFPILLNTAVGVRGVNRNFIKVARSMNATRTQLFAKVYFPSIVLPVFAGMRIGLGFGFLGALLAELFESQVGLGYLVAHYYNIGQVAQMLAVILLVFLLTISINAGMKRVENGLGRWRAAWKG
jgi:NitT/TauT family transport system permease protein